MCGGFTTQPHLAVEHGLKPMPMTVTAGRRGDSPQREPVLDSVRVLHHRVGPPTHPTPRLLAFPPEYWTREQAQTHHVCT